MDRVGPAGAPEHGDRHPRLPLRGAGDPGRGGRGHRAEPSEHPRAAALRAPVRGRAAPGLRPGERAPGHPRDQRRRDLAHRPGRRLRHRHRDGAHLAVQPAHQGPAPPDRAHLSGQREPAGGPLRAGRRRRVHPAVLRGGLRRPAGVHRARDPADLPGLGDPADGRPRPRRGRPVPVRGPARRRPDHRRGAAPRGARGPAHPCRAGRRRAPRVRTSSRAPGSPRGPWRAAAHGLRAHPGPAPRRPTAGPDAPRGRPAGLHVGGARHRRGPVDPGPPGTPGRQGDPGRPVAREVPQRHLRLRDPVRPVAVPALAATGAVR